MNTSEYLLKEILSRKTSHPIVEIHKSLNQNDVKTKTAIITLYDQLLQLFKIKRDNKLSIVFSELSADKVHKDTDLRLGSLCIDPITEKEYFTLTSELPLYKDRLNRLKFDFGSFPALVRLELDLVLDNLPK